MLKIDNLHFSYGNNQVLEGLSYHFKPGIVYALMGANGSGKSTLFHLISGFLKPNSGDIIFKSRSVKNLAPHRIADLGIARTFQDMRLIPTLTVYENLLLALKHKPSESLSRAFLFHDADRYDAKIASILEQAHLTSVQGEKAENLSYGQQKLLNLAVAIANDFELLLLDEPVAGVQPEYREQILRIIQSFKKTVIVIEHNPDFLRRLTDRILFLHRGKIIAEGDYETISADKTVQEAYL